MRINSVSQLNSKNIQIPSIIGNECYIETSFLTSVEDDLKFYNSYKLSFNQYNNELSNIISSIYDYINRKVKDLSDYIDNLSAELCSKLHDQDLSILQFEHDAEYEYFVHKNKAWTDVETIYGTKNFVNTVLISGDNSMLSSLNVIEGTARRSLWS